MKRVCRTCIKIHSLRGIAMRTRQKTIIPLWNLVTFHPRIEIKDLIFLLEKEWSLGQEGEERRRRPRASLHSAWATEELWDGSVNTSSKHQILKFWQAGELLVLFCVFSQLLRWWIQSTETVLRKHYCHVLESTAHSSTTLSLCPYHTRLDRNSWLCMWTSSEAD